MADLVVRGRSLQAQVVKLRPESEKQALRGLSEDGLDNVVFTLGGDTFVASAKALALDGVKAKQKLSLNGREGEVVALDRRPVANAKKAALWGALAGFVGAPAALGMLGLMAQPFSMGLSPAIFGAVSGLCGVGFAGLGWAMAKLNGTAAAKQASKANWAQHGEVVA